MSDLTCSSGPGGRHRGSGGDAGRRDACALDGVICLSRPARMHGRGQDQQTAGDQRGCGRSSPPRWAASCCTAGTTAMDYVRMVLDQPGRSGLRARWDCGTCPARSGIVTTMSARWGAQSDDGGRTRWRNILYLSWRFIASQPGGDESAAHPRAGRRDSIFFLVAERPALSGCTRQEASTPNMRAMSIWRGWFCCLIR